LDVGVQRSSSPSGALDEIFTRVQVTASEINAALNIISDSDNIIRGKESICWNKNHADPISIQYRMKSLG
jgi:hypothetical protein